jgi:hypothetical protein
MRKLLALILSLSSCGFIFAQTPQLGTKNGRRFPMVIFSSVLWDGNPSFYSIAIDSTGTATYQSSSNSVTQTGVPYTVEFQASDASRRMAFNVARRLDFFSGTYKNILNTPDRASVHTLGYHSPEINNQITFTESSDPDVEELTTVFEEISATFESSHRLSILLDRNRAGLANELQTLQKIAERHRVREFQVVAPVLKRIATDSGLPEPVRQQASVILSSASQSSWPTVNAP